MKLKKIVLTALSILFASVTLASCGGGSAQEETELIDYVHTSEEVRLRLDYKDRNFLTDGIGEVTLSMAIDGDTAHFKPKNGSTHDLIKSRFYGVDTPESTGKVENWGATASNFTKTKLKEAKTIVITSTSLNEYVAPETDSTGSRYLSMIWISNEENANYKDLVLLNLWLVQEGLSYVKGLQKFPEFSETFLAAESQARDNKLCLFSDEKEEGFNDGDYETTSLLDLKNEVVLSLKDPTHVNKYNNQRVRVRGTVAGYSGNMLYLQYPFLNEETGETEYAGVNIFCGMTSIHSRYTTPNTFIEVCALAQDNENFGFQLSGVYDFPKIPNSDPNSTKVIYKPSEIPEEFKVHTFEESAATLDAYTEALFSPVQVNENLTVSGGYNSSDKNEFGLYLKDQDGNRAPFTLYVTFKYQPDPENPLNKYYDYSEFVGHTFSIKGIYTFHKTSSGKINYQIVPCDSEDVVLVS